MVKIGKLYRDKGDNELIAPSIIKVLSFENELQVKIKIIKHEDERLSNQETLLSIGTIQDYFKEISENETVSILYGG